nr:hypothetical protein [Tanacetum cinerariifolium]
EDDLSAIATKLGTSLMLEFYTSDMCVQSWGRSSYARVMIELRTNVNLKDKIIVAMPKITREGHYTCNVRVEYEWKPPGCLFCASEKKTVKKHSQTSRGVSVSPKMGFKPHKEYRPVPKKSIASSSGNNKKGEEPIIEVSNSNPFDVLNRSSGTTPIIEKIRKFKDLLTSGQAILVDKEDNPLKKVEFPGEDDSEDEKSGDRHQPTTQQSSHRNHGHNNDRYGSDRRGSDDNHCSNNNYSGNNRSAGNGHDQRNRGQQSNRPVNSYFQQSKGPSEGYSYPKDCKKNTTASTSGHANKKPGASGRVFAITEDHATKTSVLVLFDTGATHYVIYSVFASCVTTTPTLLDHVLCISTPMKDSVRISHVYKDLLLQFDDKICAINALPLDMCEFDIILGMDWLTEHHATIDCRSYRVIFGDIHAPEFIYHGSLPGKSMQIIFALQARSLLSHGCE